MLFNSYLFIFIFLPISLIFFFFFRKKNETKIVLFIIISTIFYAYWSINDLLVLYFFIVYNYFYSKYILFKFKKRLIVIIVAILINLIPLIYYKYYSNNLTLPLAISFYTFQQIAFLVDVYKGKIKEYSFKEYLIFVLFFPQLIAGPIVHFKELIPQFYKEKKDYIDYISAGIVIFSIGLFKKVVLADSFKVLADKAFDGVLLNSYDAWIGLFAYSLEIYFDFSGYSDMAIGIALMFGIKLPINFFSPYKSRNIKEFWRRWHITLGNFLRDYIYIPLGGNRGKGYRVFFNLFTTMLIAGVWHGSGWGFVLWGALHGLALGAVYMLKLKIPKTVSIFITFLFVTLMWVLFRSESINSAINYYKVLFSFNNFNISDINSLLIILLGLIIIFILKNSIEFIHYEKEKFNISIYKLMLAGVVFFIALKAMASVAEMRFIYFNF